MTNVAYWDSYYKYFLENSVIHDLSDPEPTISAVDCANSLIIHRKSKRIDFMNKIERKGAINGKQSYMKDQPHQTVEEIKDKKRETGEIKKELPVHAHRIG